MSQKAQGSTDAVNLLKDWCVAVIAVDTALLTALGVALVTSAVTGGEDLVKRSVILLAVSLFSTLWVLGALPLIVQRRDPGDSPERSIYFEANMVGIPVLIFATIGHLSLIGAVVFLASFLWRI